MCRTLRTDNYGDPKKKTLKKRVGMGKFTRGSRTDSDETVVSEARGEATERKLTSDCMCSVNNEALYYTTYIKLSYGLIVNKYYHLYNESAKQHIN